MEGAQVVVGAVEVEQADDVLVAHLRPNLDLVFAFNGGGLRSQDEGVGWGRGEEGGERGGGRGEGGREGGRKEKRASERICRTRTLADTSLIATGVPLWTCMASYTLP